MHATGGEVVVRSLVAHGVKAVFGIPGVHNLAAYDALLDAPQIQHIVARHEQGAAFMADGYARASGREGICFCTSGPAALNALASLGTAFNDSSPVLCIMSQIPLAMIGKEKGLIHECRDQLACFAPVTKWCARANSVAEISELLAEAFLHMRSGRPRPVAIEIPCDILDASDEVTLVSPREIAPHVPNQAALDHAGELLSNSKAPVIWAGGGVISSGATEALLQLAERLNAPVFTTVLGKGAIADDHPLSAGTNILHPAGKEFLRQCDLMLAIGTRFTQEETNNWAFQPPDTLIHVDIDAAEIGRNYTSTLGIVADARETLEALNQVLETSAAKERVDWASDIQALRQRVVDECEAMAPDGVKLVNGLRSAIPRKAILVSDLTLAAYWSRRLLGVYEPRTNIYPWGFCTLGFGLSAAIGAKLAQPKRPVVCISGDGGFLFNCQELAVAAQFDLPIVLLVFNNNGYGVLKPQQELRYGRSLGADLVNPDFLKLAEAFGVESQRVDKLDELQNSIENALASHRTTLIEVTVEIPLPVMEEGSRAIHEALQN